MKLIIDINEEELTEDEIEEAKRIADDCFSGVKTIISDNATNGEVIKAMFPNIDNNFSNVLDLRLWWGRPYQKGGKE